MAVRDVVGLCLGAGRENGREGRGHVCTVEVVSLHTLRLESLKLVFQPLHKFL